MYKSLLQFFILFSYFLGHNWTKSGKDCNKILIQSIFIFGIIQQTSNKASPKEVFAVAAQVVI